MKFFTKNWCFGDVTEKQSNEIVSSYENYIKSIELTLLPSLKILSSFLSLHDGIIYKIKYQKNRSLFHVEGIFGDRQFGYYCLFIKYKKTSKINTRLFLDRFNNKINEILATEVLLNNKLFVHNMMFTSRHEMKIEFQDLEFKIQNSNSLNYKKRKCKVTISE